MPVVDLSDVTELYLPPPLDDVPDVDEDQPIDGTPIVSISVGLTDMNYHLFF